MNQILLECIIYGDTLGIIKDVKEDIKTPIEFHLCLFQSYPNRFNLSTNIKYQIANRQNVNLTVYEVLGNEIAVIVNHENSGGVYALNFTPVVLQEVFMFIGLKQIEKSFQRK